MKTLIVIKEQNHAWVRNAFPGIHPLLLTLCNKPYIEYLIDFAILSRSEEIRIMSDGSLGEVEAYCMNGSRWGVELTYSNIRTTDDITTILQKNSRFCRDNRTMVINGFVFVDYDKESQYDSIINTMPDGVIASAENEGCLILRGQERNPDAAPAPSPPINLESIDSIESYYRISLDILKNKSSQFVLPGYGNEPECFIGRNVVISKSAEIEKPVSIGNNVQILSGTHIGPDAIVGSNVIIDKNSTVTESIVLDNTYIGEELDITGKTAFQNMLSDPGTQAVLSMEDPHLLRSTQNNGTLSALLRQITHAITALTIIILLMLPFLLIAPLLMVQGKWKKRLTDYHGAGDKKVISIATGTIPNQGVTGKLASIFSLNRYPLLFRVIKGDLSLIGNLPAAVSDNSSAPDQDNMTHYYRPAVFSYAEAENWPVIGSDAAIVERYYMVHSNPLKDIGMTMKALINLPHKNTPK
ncbi:nucleoside-diphosphate-sugar pyrophosphorylase [Prosthecochloris sp. ZM]|uniref:nucleotidyltransferase family protein n=1 Tax=unclassified Prosthecochloris TaxID=2632826 RepID=UPI000DF7AD18|nr:MULTISPECIES: NDP-sugar synthase [unclassified Prosthecochloris]NEX12773.1 nucleoside-diphosphate-sugar pyrophosphorylase [Prosthecochloris sp.]RDD30379.1 nucleoside-diphosphate-sugar pyrophosphorylase [Prosthecochloris sp. ZM]